MAVAISEAYFFGEEGPNPVQLRVVNPAHEPTLYDLRTEGLVERVTGFSTYDEVADMPAPVRKVVAELAQETLRDINQGREQPEERLIWTGIYNAALGPSDTY